MGDYKCDYTCSLSSCIMQVDVNVCQLVTFNEKISFYCYDLIVISIPVHCAPLRLFDSLFLFGVWCQKMAKHTSCSSDQCFSNDFNLEIHIFVHQAMQPNYSNVLKNCSST